MHACVPTHTRTRFRSSVNADSDAHRECIGSRGDRFHWRRDFSRSTIINNQINRLQFHRRIYRDLIRGIGFGNLVNKLRSLQSSAYFVSLQRCHHTKVYVLRTSASFPLASKSPSFINFLKSKYLQKKHNNKEIRNEIKLIKTI